VDALLAKQALLLSTATASQRRFSADGSSAHGVAIADLLAAAARSTDVNGQAWTTSSSKATDVATALGAAKGVSFGEQLAPRSGFFGDGSRSQAAPGSSAGTAHVDMARQVLALEKSVRTLRKR
jgi:hypothetical protein